jgi:hypothetical protein
MFQFTHITPEQKLKLQIAKESWPYLAVDEDGRVFGYNNKPEPDACDIDDVEVGWTCRLGYCEEILDYVNYRGLWTASCCETEVELEEMFC